MSARPVLLPRSLLLGAGLATLAAVAAPAAGTDYGSALDEAKNYIDRQRRSR